MGYDSGQHDEKYISRSSDWRYATSDMEQPQTAESWSTMFKKLLSGMRRFVLGEIENPYVFEHSNEPEGYAY